MRFAKTILMMALALGGGAAAAAPPLPADRAALERLAADNDSAWTARDWLRSPANMPSRGTLRVAPTGPIQIGRAAIERFFKTSFERRPAGFRHVTRIDNIEMVSPEMAVADGYVRVERSGPAGWSLVREFASSSLVFVRTAGEAPFGPGHAAPGRSEAELGRPRARRPLASSLRFGHAPPMKREGGMRHYRVNKLAKVGGAVVKRKDILANDDREAVIRVQNDDDCPICDVWRDGEKIGSIT